MRYVDWGEDVPENWAFWRQVWRLSSDSSYEYEDDEDYWGQIPLGDKWRYYILREECEEVIARLRRLMLAFYGWREYPLYYANWDIVGPVDAKGHWRLPAQCWDHPYDVAAYLGLLDLGYLNLSEEDINAALKDYARAGAMEG
ncbi:MAG: hypothetical protein NTW87_02460 [Planctomycetota bacterium]|nr:hypothetical protein [Planctomycetota bacterium]